jgi:transketolase
VDARKLLQADGIPTTVVSMPCWSRFEAQPEAYQDAVLPTGPLKVAVEAASPFGWERWVGRRGTVIGISTFGDSAPAPDLYKHFGITAEAVADAVRRRL